MADELAGRVPGNRSCIVAWHACGRDGAGRRLCLLGCREPPDAPERQTEHVLRAPAVRIRQIVAAPAMYEGQSVRLDARVGRVIGPRAFVVEQGTRFTGGEIAVVASEPVRPMGVPPVAGERIVVVGVVRSGAGAARAMTELEPPLDPRVIAQLGDGPVVIARSVRRPRLAR
jgi:hypothetical protein